MSYNYLENMKKDIEQAINDNYLSDIEDVKEGTDSLDYLVDRLNDSLWTDDSVTGNASGSYTFCRATAKEYVQDNMDLVQEMASEFGIDKATIGEKFLDDEWEWFDVSIRCYLLNQAIWDTLKESFDLEG